MKIDPRTRGDSSRAFLRPAERFGYNDCQSASKEYGYHTCGGSFGLDTDKGPHKKACNYALAGIHDYWIINLINRQMEIYRDPSPEGDYQSILILGPAKPIAALDASDVQIRVADLLPPVPHSPQL